MQERPICWQCSKTVEHSPVFEAPCGHDACPSAVFHGICLMDWRQRKAELEPFQVIAVVWAGQHTQAERD